MNITTLISKPAKNLFRNLPEPILRIITNFYQRQALVPMDILPNKYQEALNMITAQRGEKEIGDYLEFGVYQGSSMSCMYAAETSIGLNKMRFIGFDSFEGMPEQSNYEDENVWHSGEFYSSLPYTRAYLSKNGVDMNRVNLIKGWFDDTCSPATVQQYNIQKAAIINIDCDLYSSTKIALEFCKQFVQDDVVIFFDDWNSYGLAEKGLGERQAFEEFLVANQQFSAQELKDLSYSKESTAFYLTRTN